MALHSNTDSSDDANYRLFVDLVSAEVRLFNGIAERLKAEHGIVTSQYGFLRYIRDHDAVRVADLAAEFVIGIGATSKAIDRQEQAGWIERRPNPANRRSSLIVLTDTGRDLVDAATATFDRELGRILGDALSPADIASLGRILRSLRPALDADGLGTPAG